MNTLFKAFKKGSAFPVKSTTFQSRMFLHFPQSGFTKIGDNVRKYLIFNEERAEILFDLLQICLKLLTMILLFFFLSPDSQRKELSNAWEKDLEKSILPDGNPFQSPSKPILEMKMDLQMLPPVSMCMRPWRRSLTSKSETNKFQSLTSKQPFMSLT